jgi:DmsE family decaheme c-type cytochrome
MRSSLRIRALQLHKGLPRPLLQISAWLACGLIGFWALTYAPSSVAQGSRATTADAQFTPAGAESCLRCHGGENMTVMAETAHGNPDDPHAPYAQQGCESCHGPGSLHVSRARGGAGFPALIKFGDKETRQEQKTACLACHGKDMDAADGMAEGMAEKMEWAGSLHDTPRMTCTSCHTLHNTANPLATREQQNESCSTCHEEEISNHRRFETKGIIFDQLTCYDCHDVHQLVGKEPQ